MDNLKIEAIFPSSISEISYAGESEFGALSIPQRMDTLTDYQIKINAPERRSGDFDEEKQEKQNNNNFQIEEQILARPIQAEYNGVSTGYYLNKDSFSEEEILKAFNIIDVNKDNLISEEDLIFVLEYIREDFTPEEVKEMIDMISADKKNVSFEEFKKLGRGEVIPLAKYKTGNMENLKEKGNILRNIEKIDLIGEDPSFLIECLKKDQISYSKFEESKKGTRVMNPVKLETSYKQKVFKIIKLKSPNEVKERKQLFLAVVVTNIEDLIQNYLQFKDKVIGIQKIANILEISIKEARELYPHETEVDSLLVMIEAIAYSRETISKKLELCLDMTNNRDNITFAEIVFIIQIIKGKDQSVQKKLQAIFQARKIQDPVPKRLAYEIVLEYSNRFFGTH